MMTQSDNAKKVQAEDAIERARREWMRLRVEQVHRNVSSFDVLARRGINLNSTSGREEQFSCPFHGVDRRPSARIYPESARGPSHAWCFVCQERWDAISLWRKFNGDSPEIPFSRTLTEIENAFGLPKLEVPTELRAGAEDFGESKSFKSFVNLTEVCEGRLRLAKPAYRKLNDMVGYLSASSILDKVRFRVEQRIIAPEKGEEVLRQLLARIGDKVRTCPDE